MNNMNVGIYSFDLKSDKQNVVHYLIDVSSFRDPMGNKALTTTCRNGTDQKVKDWIRTDPRFHAIMDSIESLVVDGKARNLQWLSIGFADHHGKWASVALADIACTLLKQGGFDVNCVHHGLIRKH